MRVITGTYKGRHFEVPRSFKARPTTDFAKENIFNVMTGYIDFEGTEALDLFAGTGSITLEMLSRGCKKVVSVEMDRDHARFIQQCIDKVGAENHTLVKGDAFRFMKSCKRQFDFIFADPPYSLPTLETIPDLALPLLKEGGMMVFEHGKQNDFSQHPRFVERRVYGAVNFSLFR